MDDPQLKLAVDAVCARLGLEVRRFDGLTLLIVVLDLVQSIVLVVCYMSVGRQGDTIVIASNHSDLHGHGGRSWAFSQTMAASPAARATRCAGACVWPVTVFGPMTNSGEEFEMKVAL